MNKEACNGQVCAWRDLHGDSWFDEFDEFDEFIDFLRKGQCESCMVSVEVW